MLMTRKMFVECRLVHADLSEYNILYHVDAEAEAPQSEPAAPESSSPNGSASGNPPSLAAPAPLQGHLHIIDVSQSVEHDHPHAFDFLRADLRNVEEFFSRRGVHTVGLRRAFEFVTRPPTTAASSSSAIDEADDGRLLRAWMDAPAPTDPLEGADAEGAGGAGDGHEDAVFLRSYIPRTLNEVFDPERDVDVLARGDGAQLIYRDTIGIVGPDARKAPAPAPAPGPGRAPEQDEGAGGGVPTAKARKGVSFAEDEEAAEGGEAGGGSGEGAAGSEEEEDEEDDESEDAASGDEGEGEGEDGRPRERRPRGHRHEDKDAKKVRTFGWAWVGSRWGVGVWEGVADAM